MRFIPTRVHGGLDYVVAATLIMAPWVLDFAGGTAATWLPVALGAATVVYSLVTDYEWGIAGVIPMPAHLGLDAANGVLLAASPWLFGFADTVWLPHLAAGAFEVAVVASSRTDPSADRPLSELNPFPRP